jgi:hypothetical protein
MDDQSLRREIESALDVDPSPEFLAKVRTRIAAEPGPSPWRLAWVMVPASAVVVIAATLLSPRSEPSGTSAEEIVQPVATHASASDPEPAPGLSPVPRGGRLQAALNRERPIAKGSVPSRANALDVLISEGEQRGFEALLVALQQNALPPVPEATQLVEPTPPLEVESFTIEPLQLTQLGIEEMRQ